MEQVTKYTGPLSNSWWSDTTSKVTNTLDITCSVDRNTGTSQISIGSGNVIGFLDSTSMQIQTYKIEVGYSSPYMITGINTSGQQAYCTIREYTSSPTLDFMVNGDGDLLLMLGLYIFFFLLGLKISFFRR